MKEPSPLSFWTSSLSILFLLACHSNPIPTGMDSVSIPEAVTRDFRIADLPGNVEYVQLETTEDSYISLIQDIQVHMGKFYILDFPGRILVFDQTGKYVGRIGNEGEGPGEFSQISSITIDGTKGRIYISSRNRLISYTLENAFEEEIKFPFFIDYLAMIGDDLSLIAAKDGEKNGSRFVNTRMLYRVDSKFVLKDSVSLMELALEKPMAATYPFKQYSSNTGERFYFYTPVLINESVLRDTLFEFDAMKVYPALKLNFEPPLFDEKGKKGINIKNVNYSKNYILCEYSRAGQDLLFLGARDGGYSVNYKTDQEKENGENAILRPLDLSRDEFYFIQKQNFSNKKNEEQNPQIGIVRLN